MRGQTYEKERAHFNVARLKKGGKSFELDIDFDKAIAFREGKISNVKDVLKVEQVFNDVKKGVQAAEAELRQLFDTSDPLEVAALILKKGEIQLTQEYRTQLREKKRKQIVNMIHVNGVDPKTHLPHPLQRIENALEEAKIHVSEFDSTEKQVQEVLKKLRPILPIRFEVKEICVKIPAEYAAKSYSIVDQFGKIIRDEWQTDGSWVVVTEMPGGLEQDFYDKLNGLCHGNVESKVLKIK